MIMRIREIKTILVRKAYSLARVIFRACCSVSFIDQFAVNRLRQIINNEINSSPNNTIVLSLSMVDWNVPLFQRPQHVAQELAMLGVTYIYNTINSYDMVFGCRKLQKNLLLTDHYDEAYKIIADKKKFIHLYSTNISEEDTVRINQAIEKGDTILYEYIDEISETISGHVIPKSIRKRHERLLRDEDSCIVIATATRLYEQVAKLRSKNFFLITNGVRTEDFSKTNKTVPSELNSLVNSNKPIIGYYGAFASWFDYSLIIEVARRRPEWVFLLIGWDYDGTLAKSGITNLQNINIIGPIPYAKLSIYAQWFTVCTIPFLINEVTMSTSPVKVFEYMAMGKPIVTTPLPECKKYKQTIISEDNPNSFIKGIESALLLVDNQEYCTDVRSVAAENTWKMKSSELLKCLRYK